MTYRETIDYLVNATPLFQHIGAGAYKEGLSNTHLFDKHFHFPHRAYRTFHVAGTNGKGSCAHTLAAILQDAGYRVGLYTSPHLLDFRERIRVNGQPIPEDYVVRFVENERSFFEPCHPSFFELTTAMAFCYFKEAQVDVAVIEVGLGGRLDCTNIIHPDLCLITNISFDHTALLGNTLSQIAAEKAGIIKKDTPVVIGEYTPETRMVFLRKAEEMKAPITFAQDETRLISARRAADGCWIYETSDYGILRGELSGDCQPANTTSLLSVLPRLQQIGYTFTTENVSHGFAKVCELTGLQGRWQTLHLHPTVVCDTGHNEGGWAYLSKRLKHVAPGCLRIVFGMVNDKDITSVLALMPRHAEFYFTKASVKRALDEKRLQQQAAALQLHGRAFPCLSEAVNQALADASAEDFIFVGGSTFIVADLLAAIQDGSVRMNGPHQNPVF